MGNDKEIIVVHIDVDIGWRGGQQQAFYLHKELVEKGISSYFICAKNSELEKRLKLNNLSYQAYNFVGKLDFFAAKKIASFCKRHNATILHAHSSRALSLALMVKFFYSPAKLIASRRVDFKIGRNVFSRMKYASKKIDMIVCISENIRKIMIECGISEAKLVTVLSGVDTKKFENIVVEKSFKEENGIPENKIIVGTTAALADHKDYPTLLKAAKIVLEKRSDVFFCSLGDGRLKDELIRLSTELEISDNFKFFGYREDVGKFLKTFDIFVLSSKMEGLGTSIIDAMALGLPIVATEAGGIPELIKNERNGLLVPKQNPVALANAILFLLENESARKKLGKQAREDSENFSFKKMAEQNFEIYKRILSSEP